MCVLVNIFWWRLLNRLFIRKIAFHIISPERRFSWFKHFLMEDKHPFILYMMTSSNGNIFRVTGHLCGEFTGPPVNSPHKGQSRGALIFSLICARINGWVNNGDAGDLRRNRAHYDVIVMHPVPWLLMSWTHQGTSSGIDLLFIQTIPASTSVAPFTNID